MSRFDTWQNFFLHCSIHVLFFCEISHDVEIAALNLHDNGILILPDILASLKAHFIVFYSSGKELAMVFHINMAMRLDTLPYFISMMFSICFV